MLFLSKTERAGRVRRHRRARSSLVGFVIAFRPSIRTGADRRRRRRSPPSGWSPAASPPRSRASASCTRTRRPATSPPTASATRPRRPRPTSTPRRRSPPRRTSPAEVTCDEDGTLVGPQPRRRRRAGHASSSPGPTPRTSASSTTAARTAGSCSTSAPGRSRRRRATTIADTEVPDQQLHALVEEGGSQFLTFSIADAERATPTTPYRFVVPGVDGAEVRGGGAVRRRRIRSATVVGACRRRRRSAVAALVGAAVVLAPRRLRRGRPAGHVAAGGRRTPRRSRTCSGRCSPIAGVVGAARRRRRRLGDRPLPRPRPADPQADPRPPGAGDRPDDPAGADPHRRRHPDRRHADGAVEDRRHRVLRQRHRPAVVVGDRLPGPGRLRRDRRRRSSRAARW